MPSMLRELFYLVSLSSSVYLVSNVTLRMLDDRSEAVWHFKIIWWHVLKDPMMVGGDRSGLVTPTDVDAMSVFFLHDLQQRHVMCRSAPLGLIRVVHISTQQCFPAFPSKRFSK